MRSSTALARVLAAQTRMTTYTRGAGHRRPGLLTHSRRRISRAPKGPTGTPPSAPTLVSVTAGNAQATIAWTDNAAGTFPITAHNIYRGTSPGGELYVGQTLAASPYVDTGLTNGTTYYYKITAVSAAGESGLSGELSGTPAAYAKPSMTSVGATVTSNAAGYDITGGSGSAYAYANTAITGPSYWEASKGSGEMIDFVSGSPGTGYSYGGFSGTNAGHTTNGFFYSQWGTPAANPAAVTTERVGYAYDPPTKTFSVYFNNVLKGSWVLTGAPANLYACFGFGPGGTDSVVYFGAAGCLYSPPSGYAYL